MRNVEPQAVYEIPAEIGRIAYDIYQLKTEVLAIESKAIDKQARGASQTTLWEIDGDTVTFTSAEALSQSVAATTFDALKASGEQNDADAVFRECMRLSEFERWRDRTASGRLLVLASECFNVVEAMNTALGAGKYDAVELLRILHFALPHFQDLAIDDAVALVRTLHTQTNGDWGTRNLVHAIGTALAHRPEKAWSLYHHVKECAEPVAEDFYVAALSTLVSAPSQQELALKTLSVDSASDSALVVKAAMRTIGVVLATTSPEPAISQRCLELLRRGRKDRNQEARFAAIVAMSGAVRHHNNLIQELLDVAHDGDQRELGVVANFVDLHYKAVRGEPCFTGMLDALIAISSDNASAIRALDGVLSELANDGEHKGLALQYFSQWFSRHWGAGAREKDLMSLFSGTIGAFLEDQRVIPQIITEWLVSEDRKLAVSCHELISYLWVHGFKEPKFSTDVLDTLSEPDLKYLARQMLGYVVSEEPLLSLTFSLLETRDAQTRTYRLVATLLRTEVGLDYIGPTLSALSEQITACDDPLRSLLKSVHDDLDNYKKAIEALPRLDELRGTTSMRRAIRMRRNREMRETMDDARDESVLRQLFTQIPVKAGLGTFMFRDGAPTDKIQFQSISHSVSLPRRLAVDPIGYEVAMFFHRLARRQCE